MEYHFNTPSPPQKLSNPWPTKPEAPQLAKVEAKMSQVTQEMKNQAEVYYGDETCREKFTSLLEEKGLPNGLLTLHDIQECGYVEDTGFVWLRHEKKRELYKFKDVVISYDAEITAYFEPNKIKNLTGVKAKEFMVWVSLTEIYVEESPSASSITFKTVVGLSRSFPVSVFEVRTVMKESLEEAKEGKRCKKESFTCMFKIS